MISFVVPAYNEEFELPGTLEAIRVSTQGLVETEIIVVDDCSTDRTPDVAEQLGARLVRINRRHIAAARNAGARAATGAHLFFVDADTHIKPVHVREGMSALEEGFAGGGALVNFRGEVPPWVERIIGPFTTLYFQTFNLAAGAFLFTTRSNFERAGGFDERHFAGEEVFFSQALKKLGPFKLLEEPVLTSGRKVRMHSGARILRAALPLLLNPWATRSRRFVQLWYDGRRETA